MRISDWSSDVCSSDLTRQKLRYRFDFDPADDGLYVMVGIHTGARMLVEGVDYRVEGREVVFPTPPGAVLDICAGCAWPERFARTGIQNRRQETRALNDWDSQVGIASKPLSDEIGRAVGRASVVKVV